MMTVAELIAVLSQFPQSARVVLEVGGDGAIHSGDLDQVRGADWSNHEFNVVIVSAE